MPALLLPALWSAGDHISAPRWLQVLALTANGHKRIEIAHQLHVSESTIKADLMFARGVLHARTTTHAVAIALRTGRIS